MMRVAIVGSRNYPDLDAVKLYVLRLPANAVVISGGARGVDLVAEQTARQRGLACEIFMADWQTHGKSAGIIRNEQIVEAANQVVAFWDGNSRGTLNTIERALKAPHIKRVTIFKVEVTL